MDKREIERLLKLTHEMVGALQEMAIHGEDTPPAVIEHFHTLRQQLSETEPEQAEEPEQAHVHLPADDYDADDSWQHDNGEMPEHIMTLDYNEPEKATPPPTISVEEKLQRAISRDLKRAFSINDRFRFERELFNGDKQAMNNAINHIESLHSFDDVMQYCSSTLGLNPENAATEEFTTIIKRYFSSSES